jgi:hypothetical protein
MRGTTTVARVSADDRGRFSIRLAAGAYTIVARAAGVIGSTASTNVNVGAGSTIAVTLTVDSGIR